MADVRFGVDLITFLHPAHWQLGSDDEVAAHGAANPRPFWDHILESVAKAGITDLELTFPPTDFATATAAYGSIGGFADALKERGLGVVSSYFGGLEAAEDPLSAQGQRQILDQARQEAGQLAACGGRFLVVGLPMRRDGGIVDLAYAQPIADLLNRIGLATLEHGVRIALHTEGHSVFWKPRDVDLFMLLTDPQYVGFCPDTGHIALGGSAPAVSAERHRDRIAIAHWKDAAGPVPDGLPIDRRIHEVQGAYFRRVGAGVVDWFAWSKLMWEIGYSGPVLLELDATPDPVHEMIQARTFVETALSRYYS